MRILITGATGFIGTALVPQLLARNHHLTAFVRDISAAQAKLPASPNIEYINTLDYFQHLDQFDAVINLAGEPIFHRRWTDEQKRRLKDSRVALTQQLADLINRSTTPPCFISGSATGYYGDGQEQVLHEGSAQATNFIGELCQAWEAAALQARTRVCIMRTGMVLGKQGGALAKMLPLYSCCLGAKLGSGQQYWAWIALEDMVNAMLFLLEQDACQGVFNLVAPHAIRQKDFHTMLGRAIKRPQQPFAAPALMLKCLLGERASLLLDSQHIQPQHLLAQGFQFRYPTLSSYLPDLI